MSKNKKWSSAEKLNIALLAIKGEMTLNDLCQEYQVAPSQVHVWKKQLLEQGATLFEKTDKAAKKSAVEAERVQNQLYKKIGQLTMERDFLKKAWSIYQGSKGED